MSIAPSPNHAGFGSGPTSGSHIARPKVKKHACWAKCSSGLVSTPS